VTLTEKTLQDYAYYLSLERNLSPHTRASYLSDLNAFFSLVPKEPVEVVPGDIVDYLTEISDLLSKRSQARLLSALRSFFTWMTLEGDRPDNPCDGIDTPKLGRYLPEVLSVEEVEAILESVDLSKRFGRRDRAILEVLYGCGLRVSELTDLQVSHVYLDEGFVRVVGKGNKERLVPLGGNGRPGDPGLSGSPGGAGPGL
jgi:integrase/recombinase XerD